MHFRAGKSTITAALFRLVEIEKGSIILDGVDLSTLGLSDVRGRRNGAWLRLLVVIADLTLMLTPMHYFKECSSYPKIPLFSLELSEVTWIPLTFTMKKI